MFGKMTGVSPAVCVSLLMLGGVGVSSASGQISFSEEAAARGVSFLEGPTNVRWGGGMALVDLDMDGDLDMVLGGGFGNLVALYENDGTGNFTSRSTGSGILPIATSTVTCADYDRDGDPDLFLGGWLMESKLYRNNGDFTFTDVSAESGLNILGAAMGSSWGDFNNDGFLDLYIPTRTGTNGFYLENQLMRNNTNGTFTNVATSVGVESTGDPTLLSAFFDFDRDGDDDLYLGTDKGSATTMWFNRLYRNNGDGTMTEITEAANARADIDCMSIAVGDVNNDGFYDLYMSDATRNPFLIQDGNGVYVDYADEAGVGDGDFSWGSVLADFDNDTILDLFVTSTDSSNSLYQGVAMADWPMPEVTVSAGVEFEGECFTVATGDVNGDGLLDMLVGQAFGPYRLYINTSSAGNQWVRFVVDGTGTYSTRGVGTCVSVQAGGKTQTAQVRSGVHYKVSEDESVHFGLGTSTVIPIVDVYFPGNVHRRMTGAPAGYSWTIYPEERLGDVDGDGEIAFWEVRAALAAYTGSGVKIEPGAEIFDMDGDFDVDYDDVALMGYKFVDPAGPRGPRRR